MTEIQLKNSNSKPALVYSERRRIYKNNFGFIDMVEKIIRWRRPTFRDHNSLPEDYSSICYTQNNENLNKIPRKSQGEFVKFIIFFCILMFFGLLVLRQIRDYSHHQYTDIYTHSTFNSQQTLISSQNYLSALQKYLTQKHKQQNSQQYQSLKLFMKDYFQSSYLPKDSKYSPKYRQILWKDFYQEIQRSLFENLSCKITGNTNQLICIFDHD